MHGNLTQKFEAPVTPTRQTLHQLRAPVTDFVGRQPQIDQLVQTLTQATQTGAAAISIIRGMGGVGKTELAYAVAQRLTDTFPDAQLLLEMRGVSDNPMTPEQALQDVIRAFEPDRADLANRNLDELERIYVAHLNNKRVLILADNVRDAAQVRPLMPPSGCALLLTTRHRFALPGMGENETVDLGILSWEEAKQLLLKISPRIGPSAHRLTELCGRLPLALRVVASLIQNSLKTVEQHVKDLENERERVRRMHIYGDTDMDVEASLQLSYSALDPNAQELLCQLSVFPASFLRLSALEVVKLPGREQESDQSPIEELLDVLYQRSLLEKDDNTERLSLHDLVRAFATPRLQDEATVRLRHAQHYAQVAASADNLFREGRANVLVGLKLFDQERANIDAGWGWAQAQTAGASPEVDTLLLWYANATAYIGDLRYDKRRERIPQLLAALEAARRLGNRNAEGNALGNLGNAYLNLGDARKAIEYHEQVLTIAREIGDRRGEGNALGNLGNAYQALGDAHKAIEYYEQHLAIAREIGDRQGEGSALGNLGNAYADLGDAHKAIEYYEQRLTIAREIGDRQGEAITSWNLGLLLEEQGNLEQAVAYMQVMVDYEREIGHADSEKHAARLEQTKAKLSPSP